MRIIISKKQLEQGIVNSATFWMRNDFKSDCCPLNFCRLIILAPGSWWASCSSLTDKQQNVCEMLHAQIKRKHCSSSAFSFYLYFFLLLTSPLMHSNPRPALSIPPLFVAGTKWGGTRLVPGKPRSRPSQQEGAGPGDYRLANRLEVCLLADKYTL